MYDLCLFREIIENPWGPCSIRFLASLTVSMYGFGLREQGETDGFFSPIACTAHSSTISTIVSRDDRVPARFLLPFMYLSSAIGFYHQALEGLQ